MKRKAFTLIELLVVVAIIALLLAVIMPALRRAKEAGQRIVCSAHLNSFGIANVMYANDHNNAYVPIYYTSSSGSASWISNEAFRSYLDLDLFEGDPTASDYNTPDAFLCPADRIGNDPANIVSTVLLSYGYNYTDWGWDSVDYAGHKTSDIPLPAVKLAFTDSIDWWVQWASADYRKGWDVLGQANIRVYKDEGLHGPTIYRHNEGVNIGYYDGHVDYLRKEVVFDAEAYDADPDKPGKMWVANYRRYLDNN